MLLEELLRDEKSQARIEAVKEDIFLLLEELGEIPEELRDEVEQLNNSELLKILVKKSAKTDSIEAFALEMKALIESEKEK